MRIIDRSRGSRTSRLARYTQIERKGRPGPLAVLRRRAHEGGRSRLAQFMRIARGRTA